jgi:hypothetical protein
MSHFYAEMADVATELLTEFNQGVITLTKPGTTTPGSNPWDPPVVTDPVEYALQATAKGVSKELIDGTLIVATDIEIAASAFGADPEPADELAIDGKAVTLLKVMRLPAAGKLVAWRFVVRG